MGVQICLHKEAGDEGGLLADEGYGITQLVSILLQIETAILSLILMREQRRYYSGIEMDDSYGNEVWTLAIEEPEIHLHPKYQSLLADMFVEAYQKYNIHFIIETHSEYLIRKLQVMVADKERALNPNDLSLNYVEKGEDGISHNRQIKIREDGGLIGHFGSGFFDEADGLALELFRRKPILS